MSSLFSYELDEAQIRLTLQNSRAVEYSESNWDDFEANYSETCSGQTNTSFKLPEFNLNINRNVVLPVIFIASLVGVSAIMLSFVDFKTNSPSKVEKQLIPDPTNFTPEKTKSAAIVKKEPGKETEERPVVKPEPAPVKTETLAVINTTSEARKINTQSVNNTSMSENTTTQARVVKTDTSSVSNTLPSNITPVGQINTGHKKKRRRKLPADQIETIKAPALISQEDASSKEPELELKLN